MFALDAATGKVMWSFPSGGSVNAGAVVVDGTVYWGSGLRPLGVGRRQKQILCLLSRRQVGIERTPAWS
jgi:outer membrane protein assembly factor BamB